MSLPRFSIITPSLNQGPYLERALSSVREQSYPHIEHIVVDGGSTDASVGILEQNSHLLAYWASEPDRGQAHAINKGIALASGEIVAYLNSDDYYLPGALSAVADAFVRRSVEWVAGGCRYENATGEVVALDKPTAPVGPRAGWIRAPWHIPQASSFWHRTVFEEYGGFREDLHYVLDTEFTVRLALHGVLPTPVDAELAVRYLHDAAKSADPASFRSEWARVQPDLERFLTTGDRAEDFASRGWASLRHRAGVVKQIPSRYKAGRTGR